MKTFRERCENKVYNAVNGMIVGLETQQQRADFHIEMITFGHSVNGTCFGCAATCTIQQLSGINLDADDISSEYGRAASTDSFLTDLSLFEAAINNLRCGNLLPLFQYMYDVIGGFNKFKEISSSPVLLNLPTLTTYNWEKYLHFYKDFYQLLKEKNL